MSYNHLGPSSQDITVLKELIANGLNIVRMNFSHGSYEVGNLRIFDYAKNLKFFKIKFLFCLFAKLKYGEGEDGGGKCEYQAVKHLVKYKKILYLVPSKSC